MKRIMNGLVLIIGAGFLAGCMAATPPVGQSTPTAAPTPVDTPTRQPVAIGTVTLTEFFDEMRADVVRLCRLSAASDAIADGPVVLTVVNETESAAVVDVWRIEDGHSYRDFEADVAGQYDSLSEGGSAPDHPSWVQRTVSISVDAGDTATEEALASPGTYGITCTWPDLQARGALAISATGPVEID